MGDTTHSVTTPSSYRKAQSTGDKANVGNQGDPKLIRSFFDGELWNDLACVVYSIIGTDILAAGATYTLILPFEMPVDGRIEPQHTLLISYDGLEALVTLMQAAVVRRGGTPAAFTTTGVVQVPVPGAAFTHSVAGAARTFDVAAGKWDLWIQVQNLNVTKPINIELSIAMRRGRKPAS